jgi:hypothetical protein
VLETFAAQGGWVNLDMSALNPEEAGAALAELIRQYLHGRATSGDTGGRQAQA